MRAMGRDTATSLEARFAQDERAVRGRGMQRGECCHESVVDTGVHVLTTRLPSVEYVTKPSPRAAKETPSLSEPLAVVPTLTDSANRRRAHAAVSMAGPPSSQNSRSYDSPPNTRASSTDRRNSPAKHLGWFHPTERLSRAVVEAPGDGVEVSGTV